MFSAKWRVFDTETSQDFTLASYSDAKGDTSKNSENNNSDVATTYGCLHQWLIDT